MILTLFEKYNKHYTNNIQFTFYFYRPRVVIIFYLAIYTTILTIVTYNWLFRLRII